MKQFLIEFWEWCKFDLLDSKQLCVKQTEDGSFKAPESRWCSPEYMSYKTEIPVDECREFLLGPVGSNRCGLWLYRKQREKMSNTDLTELAELNDYCYQAFTTNNLNKHMDKLLKPIEQNRHKYPNTGEEQNTDYVFKNKDTI